MSIQQSLLEVAKISLGSLPESGQIEAFNHLDSTVRTKIVSDALANMSEQDRRAILSAYPEVPRGQFEQVYLGTHSKLEVRQGDLGREVKWTVSQGSSEDLARKEINAHIKKLPNCPADFEVYFVDEKKEQVILTAARSITFTVIDDATGRVKYIKDASNGESDPKTSHEALLVSLKNDWVENIDIRLSTGAFRVANGFPKNENHIGTEEDEGDLLKGLVVRARVGDVTSYCFGVYGSYYCDDDANAYIGVAGAPLPN